MGRTARIGEKGEALLFLQPVEIDYLKDLKKHGATLAEYPLLKVLDKFPLLGNMPRVKKVISLESHPWVISLQRGLEFFTYADVCFSFFLLYILSSSAWCSDGEMIFSPCLWFVIFAAEDEEPGEECVCLLGQGICSSQGRAQEHLCGEEASLGSCRQELCSERAAFFGWEITP